MPLIGRARPDAAGPRSVLVVLCVTQITGWGVLFYAFPVLAPRMAAAEGWSPSWIVAGFALARIMSAVVGIPLGRVLDRRGPRAVMTGGSLLAALAVAGVAVAPNLAWFTAAWAFVGVAMGAVLYQPAFAALTRWHGPDRVRALTVLTLAGGLASTVFAPLTAVLATSLDWRGTYLVLAAVLAAITVPAHFLGLRRPWPSAAENSDDDLLPDLGRPERIARSRPFAVLVLGLCLGGFAVYAVVIALVPLLTERGLSPTTAAWALGLGGVGQVAGRVAYGRLAAATSVRARTALILSAAAVTTALLGVLPGPAPLLFAVAVLAGAARGVFTLLHATAIADRWGIAHYGRLSGLLSAPLTVTSAIAPWAATTLAVLFGGYSAVFGVLAVMACLAALSTLSVPAPARPGQPLGRGLPRS